MAKGGMNLFKCTAINLFLLLALVAGCETDTEKENTQLDLLSSLSHSGRFLTVLAGSPFGFAADSRIDPSKESRFIIIDLHTGQYRKLPKGHHYSHWFMWKPKCDMETFCFKTLHWNRLLNTLNGNFFTGQALSDDDTLKIPHSMSDYPNLSNGLSYSPDGSILIGMASSYPHKEFSGKLAFSYDGGKTIDVTDFKMYHRGTFWPDNNSFYYMPDSKTLARIIKEGSDFKSTDDIIKSSRNIFPKGHFRNSPVYSIGTQLFCGDTMLLEHERYTFVKAEGDFIIAESDGVIYLFDDDLSASYRKELPAGTHLLEYDPENEIAYLIKDWQSILAYNINSDKDPKEVFNISMLD